MLPQSSAWHGHRDMLHDRERNSAYDRAISAAVRDISSSNRTAVDVGTGSGLLAMFAARAGASVTAFETVPALAHLARDVVRENGLADSIAVVGAHSTEAPPPARRAQLLVHELLDTASSAKGCWPACATRTRCCSPTAPLCPRHRADRAARFQRLHRLGARRRHRVRAAAAAERPRVRWRAGLR